MSILKLPQALLLTLLFAGSAMAHEIRPAVATMTWACPAPGSPPGWVSATSSVFFASTS